MFADAIPADASALMDGIHPKDRDRVLGAIRAAAEDLADASFEHRAVRSDGATRWVHARVVPMSNEEGPPVLWASQPTSPNRSGANGSWRCSTGSSVTRNDMAVVLG